jgi:hypothetical protein
MNVAKSCLTCDHFRLDLGEAGYSELTPGSPASIGCEMARVQGCAWPKERSYRDDEGPLEVPALRTRAEMCAWYETHRDLLTASAPDAP